MDRLKKQPFGSSEGAVLRCYLDTVLELPWNVTTKERVDVAAAKRILDKDHFGMEKVKERILETLAVRKMAPRCHRRSSAWWDLPVWARPPWPIPLPGA